MKLVSRGCDGNLLQHSRHFCSRFFFFAFRVQFVNINERPTSLDYHSAFCSHILDLGLVNSSHPVLFWFLFFHLHKWSAFNEVALVYNPMTHFFSKCNHGCFDRNVMLSFSLFIHFLLQYDFFSFMQLVLKQHFGFFEVGFWGNVEMLICHQQLRPFSSLTGVTGLWKVALTIPLWTRFQVCHSCQCILKSHWLKLGWNSIIKVFLLTP